mmetsp:Transcript_836/g.2013  ORF Transcript_836/g.2013 Transcript_836/m.2013 type:complete len:294 (-) Transcript_836:589-1470(-)
MAAEDRGRDPGGPPPEEDRADGRRPPAGGPGGPRGQPRKLAAAARRHAVHVGPLGQHHPDHVVAHAEAVAVADDADVAHGDARRERRPRPAGAAELLPRARAAQGHRVAGAGRPRVVGRRRLPHALHRRDDCALHRAAPHVVDPPVLQQGGRHRRLVHRRDRVCGRLQPRAPRPDVEQPVPEGILDGSFQHHRHRGGGALLCRAPARPELQARAGGDTDARAAPPVQAPKAVQGLREDLHPDHAEQHAAAVHAPLCGAAGHARVQHAHVLRRARGVEPHPRRLRAAGALPVPR